MLGTQVVSVWAAGLIVKRPNGELEAWVHRELTLAVPRCLLDLSQPLQSEQVAALMEWGEEAECAACEYAQDFGQREAPPNSQPTRNIEVDAESLANPWRWRP